MGIGCLISHLDCSQSGTAKGQVVVHRNGKYSTMGAGGSEDIVDILHLQQLSRSSSRSLIKKVGGGTNRGRTSV
jgi:hypothetical protein